MNPQATPRTRTGSLLPAAVRPLMLAALMGLAPIAGAQEVDYTLDTGVGNFNIGPSQFDANMTWMNSFDTIEGGELITQVSVSFGDIEDDDGIAGSDIVTIAILNDPTDDHDPSDATLLSTSTGTWAEVGFSNFIDYDIEPTEVDGVFFVAVMMDVRERANPATMDPNSPSLGTQSWMYYNPKPNLEDLNSSPCIRRMADTAFVGAWMIRAVGEPAVTTCAVDYTGDGALDFFDVSAFLDLFAAQDPLADLTDDGAFDFFDVSDFLDQFGAGCP